MEDQRFGVYGYDEIVDTCVDAVRAEMQGREALADKKVDLGKVFSFALNQFPKVKEAVDDFDVFLDEAGDLFADESIEAFEEIKSKLSPDQISKSRLFRVYEFAAKGHQNTNIVIDLGKQQLALGKEQLALGAAIFAKGDRIEE